jgi:hypothetical protein
MLKNRIVIMCTIVSMFAGAQTEQKYPTARQTVDKILAICYTPEGVSVIAQSDLRPGIDGMPRQLKDIVLNRLMFLDNKKLKKSKEESETEQKADDDRYLARIQKQFKLTHDDVVKLFKDMGYTFEEGMAELRSMRVIDGVLDIRVRSKVLIDKKDIEAYCEKNPTFHPAVYTVSIAAIPVDPRLTKAEQTEKIEQARKSPAELSGLDWSEPIEQSEADIASEKAFIKEVQPGDVIIFEETPQEIKLLKMISKKPAVLISCEERTKEVNNILGKQKFEKALEKYHEDLWAQAHVRYIDQDSQPEQKSVTQDSAIEPQPVTNNQLTESQAPVAASATVENRAKAV